VNRGANFCGANFLPRSARCASLCREARWKEQLSDAVEIVFRHIIEESTCDFRICPTKTDRQRGVVYMSKAESILERMKQKRPVLGDGGYLS